VISKSASKDRSSLGLQFGSTKSFLYRATLKFFGLSQVHFTMNTYIIFMEGGKIFTQCGIFLISHSKVDILLYEFFHLDLAPTTAY
jgi:hypothetical protein